MTSVIFLVAATVIMFVLMAYMFFSHRNDLDELSAYNRIFALIDRTINDESMLSPHKEARIKEIVVDLKDHLRRLRL